MAGIPKLIVLSEQLRGKSFELTKDLHTVGRSEERDICIKDPTISTYHCEFIRNGNAYMLRDNNSTNGTRVNNVPVSEQLLQNSDILQIGGVEILFDCDDKSVTTVMRTKTGIDLESTEVGVSTVRRMDNFSPISSRKLTMTQLLLIGVVILLVIAILGLLSWIGILLMGQQDQSNQPTMKSIRKTTLVKPVAEQSFRNRA